MMMGRMCMARGRSARLLRWLEMGALGRRGVEEGCRLSLFRCFASVVYTDLR